MKTIISAVALTLISFATSAIATDAVEGKNVFYANCTTCHPAGKNVLVPGKTLSKVDLETNQVNSVAAIIELITNGKGSMRAYSKLGFYQLRI